MTSVERVMQFTSLPQEKTEGPKPPANWPQKARVVFKDLTLRYDKDADPVLKRLNVTIELDGRLESLVVLELVNLL